VDVNDYIKNQAAVLSRAFHMEIREDFMAVEVMGG
jgi:hypothetical protein